MEPTNELRKWSAELLNVEGGGILLFYAVVLTFVAIRSRCFQSEK